MIDSQHSRHDNRADSPRDVVVRRSSDYENAGGSGTHAEGMRSDGSQESAFAFLAFAWRRKWVVVLSIFIVSALGYLYYLRQAPIFQSDLQAIVIKPSTPFAGTVFADVGLSTAQLDMIMTSARVVRAAISEHQLDKLPGLVEETDPTRKIVRGLSVRSRTADVEGYARKPARGQNHAAYLPKPVSGELSQGAHRRDGAVPGLPR